MTIGIIVFGGMIVCLTISVYYAIKIIKLKK